MCKTTQRIWNALGRYPFMPGLLLIVILVVIFTLSPESFAAHVEQTPHDFRPGFAEVQDRSQTSGGFHKEAISRSVYAALKHNGARKSYEHYRWLILKVVDAASEHDIDPFVAVTVVFQESRFIEEIKGDGGRACGMAQQHARWSVAWKLADSESVKQECEGLLSADYSARVLMHHLGLIKGRTGDLRRYVYQYNGSWDGRGFRYWGNHIYWRVAIERAYDRMLSRDNIEAKRADSLRRSHRYWITKWRQERKARKALKEVGPATKRADT